MAYSDIILTLVVVAFAVEIVLIDRNLSKITDVITKAFPYNTSPTVEQDEASKTDLLRIQSEVKVLSDLLQEERDRKVVTATTYIRWGREDCSGNTTDLVYSGYVGGSHFSHTGSAVDYVCLPKDPSWGPITDQVTTGYGLMYGAEYENIIVYKVPDLNREVPCAVCRESSYSTTIMIPARTTCYPGW
ncbi:uncharacterized protein [Argopecten irradians]|uniref:uncharacterized protein isoform X1 n=1 Tax=Argopecten irradians TaxID=31199 RepID=UPI003718309E